MRNPAEEGGPVARDELDVPDLIARAKLGDAAAFNQLMERFGGEVRCGRGRTEDKGYLTVCGWADPQTAGVVAFVSSRKQLELNTEFYAIRDTLDGTVG